MICDDINTKSCSKCKQEKSLSDFYRDKSCNDGRCYRCKDCDRESVINYQHTKAGLVAKIYGHQKETSKRRGNQPPIYTRIELLNWLLNQQKFHELFNNWMASGYQKMMRPSCDRLDDYRGYSLDRLQIMTWSENYKKGNNDRKNGVNNKRNKAVIQLTLEGIVVNEYYSISQAGRTSGVDFRHISACCNERQKTAGGFVWALA